MSLRGLARQLGVSPSFVSQIENGKSQPSVATLYSLAQLLNVSIDELFEQETTPAEQSAPTDPVHGVISRANLGSPADGWPPVDSVRRVVIAPSNGRPRLVMDSGVIWEQLVSNGDVNLDFMEVVYPAGSRSTNDGRMLRHEGYEYAFLLTGELQITHGFETYILRAGESMALDSAVPHLFTNLGTKTARGIWCVHHCANKH
jgi:transcriptional regulator with XRE-family HTH domain/quercetin dioxygenase-like cupin family protein